VLGFGQQYGHHAIAALEDQSAMLLPKIRIELLVQDEQAEGSTDAIAKAVSTGSIGDGKFWVCPVESALHVRTGEHDRAAV
jgi:nitrogen regulatory protein P-II 1